MGQLSRVQLLSDDIIHHCVKYLFGETEALDEDKIEFLCILLQAVGYQLEIGATKNAEHDHSMKKYLKDLKALSENMAMSLRVRFMCKDLLEMRANGWTAKHETPPAKRTDVKASKFDMKEAVEELPTAVMGTALVMQLMKRGGGLDIVEAGAKAIREIAWKGSYFFAKLNR